MPELTIAASATRALMELAVTRGASRGMLEERSGIAPADLEDRDNRVPFGRYVALMRAGQELCRDPALGLHFGEAFDATDISIVCAVGGDAGTVAGCLAQINRYARLAVEVEGSGDRLVLSRRGGLLWLIDTRKNPNDFPELTESTFARMVCTARRFPGGATIVKAVHVTHAEPAHRAEYDRIFQVPVVFGSDRNALVLDEALLTARLPVPPRYVSEILRAHADVLLTRLERSKSVRGRVESLLMPLLRTGDTGIATIAGRMGVSRQTLFRRLRAEGVTYERVLDELRHRTALHYLSGRKASVRQTAHRLGFSDSTAFSRAFRRWTGSSPSAVRRASAPARD